MRNGLVTVSANGPEKPPSQSTGSTLRDWDCVGGLMGEKSWSLITAKFLWTQDRITFPFIIFDTMKDALHMHTTSSRQIWHMIFCIHLWAKSVWHYLKKNFTSLSVQLFTEKSLQKTALVQSERKCPAVSESTGCIPIQQLISASDDEVL